MMTPEGKRVNSLVTPISGWPSIDVLGAMSSRSLLLVVSVAALDASDLGTERTPNSVVDESRFVEVCLRGPKHSYLFMEKMRF